MEEKKPEQEPREKFHKPRRNFNKNSNRYNRDNQNRERGKDRQDGRRDYRRDNTRGRRDSRENPQKPRNIRYGTKFCGECRACKFWLNAKFGRYRCENSYLPFEILEFRRDGNSNQITEIVLNLLV